MTDLLSTPDSPVTPVTPRPFAGIDVSNDFLDSARFVMTKENLHETLELKRRLDEVSDLPAVLPSNIAF